MSTFFGHTSVTGGLIDDGLLGAVVLVPIQAAVLSSLGVDLMVGPGFPQMMMFPQVLSP